MAASGLRQGLQMSLWGRKLQEVVRALCVMALVFLNFGHVPLAVGGETVVVAAAHGFCGHPIDGPASGKKAECQLCRVGAGADLPSPPRAMLGLDAAHQVHYVPHRPAIVLRAVWRSAAQRAPPVLV
jgi:hypothetical protein